MLSADFLCKLLSALFLGVFLLMTGPVERPALAQERRPAYGDYLASLAAQRRFDIDAAAAHSLRALQGAPDNLQLVTQAFNTTAANGDMDLAFALADEMIARGTANDTMVLMAVASRVQRGDLAGAEELLSQSSGRGLAAIGGALLRLWVEAGQDKDWSQDEVYRRYADDRGVGSLFILHQALALDLLNQDEAAVIAMARMQERTERTSLRGAMLIANFQLRRGQSDQARATLETYRETAGGSALEDEQIEAFLKEETPLIQNAKQGLASAYFDLASLLANERANMVALMLTNAALYLDPNLAVASILEGEIYQSAQRHEEAVEAYRVVEQNPLYGWSVSLRISEELIALEDDEGAIEVLRRLSDARPDRFEPHYRLGNLLRRRDRFDEAATAYEKAVETIGEPSGRYWSLYYFRGISYERSDRWEQAEADFLKALELEPEQPYVMNYLAYSWVEQKRNLEEAEHMLLKAVEARPDDGAIVDSLGWVYYRLGRFEEAVNFLEKAAALRAQDPVINDHLGDAYWRLGRKREARVQWQRAISLEPEPEVLEQILEKLERGLAPFMQDS